MGMRLGRFFVMEEARKEGPEAGQGGSGLIICPGRPAARQKAERGEKDGAFHDMILFMT
jgi:hypothetical protein